MSTATFLRKLITYRPWLYLTNCLLWSLVYLGPILPGLVIREFFDALTGDARYISSIWALAAIFVAIGGARVVTIFLGMYADVVHRFSTIAILQRNMLHRILEMPGARALPEPPGDAISRFRDDGFQAENAVDWTLDLLGSGVFAVTAFIILSTISLQLTVLVFLPLVVVVAFARAASSRVGIHRQASRKATEEVTSALGEAFAAVQAIQVAVAEEHVAAHVERLNEARRDAMVKDRVFTRMVQSLYLNTVGVGTGIILLVAATSLQDGSLTVGDFALYVYYLGFVTDFVQQLGQFLTTYQQTGVSVDHMQRLMQGAPTASLVRHERLQLRGALPEPAHSDVHDPLGTLEIRNLTYHHPGTERGISSVDLTLERGSFTVVTGEVGSGKTTLLRTLLGLLLKQRGEVRWNGQVVAHESEFFAPARSAYVAQVPQLFSTTLRENILVGAGADDARVQGALREAVMEEDVAGFPHGLDTLLGPRGVRLSGGQVQRAAAARALVRDPSLLVLDDLSSALDVETEEALWARRAEDEHTTYLAVSHRHGVFLRADNIVVLKEGMMEAEGTAEELLASSDEFRRIWHGDVRTTPDGRQGSAPVPEPAMQEELDLIQE